MSDTESAEVTTESGKGESASSPKRTLNGGLDPREMAQRSASVRRERKLERETDAQLDALTVHGRLAVAAARKLKTGDLEQVFANLLKLSKGEGHVAVNASNTLIRLASQQVEGDEQTDGIDPSSLTPAQRAVARAAIADALADLEEGGHPREA